jgi:putative exosortase-associated protein (TIGR04073 family)
MTSAFNETKLMRKSFSLLSALLMAGLLATGCADADRKMGRGVANLTDVVRLGELRRSMEQTAVFQGADAGYTFGVVHGLNRSLARAGIGVYEIVTAPIPPYDPAFPVFLSKSAPALWGPGPVYPDNFTPGLMEDSLWATDANLGFAGGDVAPIVPGSRFRIFDNH